MTSSTLKIVSGIIIILSHIGALLFVAVEYRNRMLTEEMIEIGLILSPIFGLYTTVVITDSIANRYSVAKGRTVNFMFVFVTLSFLIAFSSLIFLALIGYANGDIETEEELRRTLAAVETMLGIILGIIIHAVYPQGASSGNG